MTLRARCFSQSRSGSPITGPNCSAASFSPRGGPDHLEHFRNSPEALLCAHSYRHGESSHHSVEGGLGVARTQQNDHAIDIDKAERALRARLPVERCPQLLALRLRFERAI